MIRIPSYSSFSRRSNSSAFGKSEKTPFIELLGSNVFSRIFPGSDITNVFCSSAEYEKIQPMTKNMAANRIGAPKVMSKNCGFFTRLQYSRDMIIPVLLMRFVDFFSGNFYENLIEARQT